jgi:hypothetical protein
MRELVEFLAKSLVDAPDSVRVREIGDGRSITLEVRVAPDDMGKVIGRRGRTVNAIRTVAKAAAVKEGVYVDVEIVD